MSSERKRHDHWGHVEGGASMTTEVYSDDQFVHVKRTIKRQRKGRVTVLSFAHGDELDRLIVAVQRARTERARRMGWPGFAEFPDSTPSDVGGHRARHADAEAVLGQEG